MFPMGFMIASGNEDWQTWVQMLTYLKETCPIISQQGCQGLVHDNGPLHEKFFAFVLGCNKISRRWCNKCSYES